MFIHLFFRFLIIILSMIWTANASATSNNSRDEEFTCILDDTLDIRPDISSLSEQKCDDHLQISVYDIAQNFFSTFLPVLEGKAVELLQGDACQVLKRSYFKQDDELYAFCDNIANMPLSKAGAKSLGKVAKAFQGGKSGFALVGAGVSAYGSVKLSETLIGSVSMPQMIALTTMAIAFEQYSQPQAAESLLKVETNDYYLAFDHWLARPFIYRTASTGCRYTLEKLIQRSACDEATQKQLTTWILRHSLFSPRSAQILSRGSSIGFSKLVSGALAASVISLAEISLDALQDEPEFNSHSSKIAKYFKDVGIAIGSNILITVALPTTLVVGTPRKIVFGFLIANTLHWLVYSPK